MKDDYACMLLHFCVVSLHSAEVYEANKLTITVLIACVYATLSLIELYKIYKKDFKHEHTNKN